MAKLRVFQSIANNVWELKFVNDLPSLALSDKLLMLKFGEPEIEVGGVYLGGTANEFTLPTKKARILSDFTAENPFVQLFDASTAPFNSATQTKIEGYRDAVVAAFTLAFTTLRSTYSSNTFAAEKVYDNL